MSFTNFSHKLQLKDALANNMFFECNEIVFNQSSWRYNEDLWVSGPEMQSGVMISPLIHYRLSCFVFWRGWLQPPQARVCLYDSLYLTELLCHWHSPTHEITFKQIQKDVLVDTKKRAHNCEVKCTQMKDGAVHQAINLSLCGFIDYLIILKL